jgi:hypothetical protein
VPTIAVPFDHEYVPPPVALNVSEFVEQVITLVAGATMDTVGAVLFWVMV